MATFGIIPGRRSDDFQARFIAFAHHLDPNLEGLPRWEPYGDQSNPQILQFGDLGSTGMIPDDFRQEAMDYYLTNLQDFRILSA